MSNAPVGWRFVRLYDFNSLKPEEVPALLDAICAALDLSVRWRRIEGEGDVEFLVEREREKE